MAAIILSLLVITPSVMPTTQLTQSITTYSGTSYDAASDGPNIVAELTGSAVGDDYLDAYTPRSTVVIYQAATASWSYNESYSYCSLLYCTWVDSMNHRLRVIVSDTPNQDAYLVLLTSDYKDALDTLWNTMMSIANLPLPSPWGLVDAAVSSNGQPEVTTYNTDQLLIIDYNTDPELLGAYWTWLVGRPIQEGVYRVSIAFMGTVVIWHDDQWLGTIWYDEYDHLYIHFWGIHICKRNK